MSVALGLWVNAPNISKAFQTLLNKGRSSRRWTPAEKLCARKIVICEWHFIAVSGHSRKSLDLNYAVYRALRWCLEVLGLQYYQFSCKNFLLFSLFRQKNLKTKWSRIFFIQNVIQNVFSWITKKSPDQVSWPLRNGRFSKKILSMSQNLRIEMKNHRWKALFAKHTKCRRHVQG